MSSILVSHPAAVEPELSWRVVYALERAASAAIIALLSPLLVVIGIAIVALSGRGPLIAHRRVGQNGSALWVLKFRTMWERPRRFCRVRALLAVERIDDEVGPGLKHPEDERVAGRFARFCRRHSLDELPQLWHVLMGQMSLVGPRPATPGELEKIYGSEKVEILLAKPGLAGLWQVCGRNRLTLQQRRRLDLDCVRNRSLRLYFWILMRTIPEVFYGTNTW